MFSIYFVAQWLLHMSLGDMRMNFFFGGGDHLRCGVESVKQFQELVGIDSSVLW